MDRDTAVTRIQDGLGFRTDLTEKIHARLQEAQRELERGKSLPWFLIEEDDTINLSEGANEVSLPDRFIRETEYPTMRYTDSDGNNVRVPKKDFNDALDAYGDSDDSAPKVYALLKDSFYFFPTADDDYTLTLSYYKGAQVITSNIENAWLEHAPEWLIGEAGIKIALDTRDQDAMKIFTDMRDKARDAIMSEHYWRQDMARSRSIGGGN